jgi:predicted ribonuclease YlaK
MTPASIAGRDWYDITNTRRMTRLRIVVPMLVVDELDNLKDRGPEKNRPHARDALKLFREAFAFGPDWRHTIDPPPDAEQPDLWNVDMTLLVEPLEYERLDHNDSELIRQALWLHRASGRPVSIVSRDTGQVFRAQAQGLTAHHVDV